MRPHLYRVLLFAIAGSAAFAQTDTSTSIPPAEPSPFAAYFDHWTERVVAAQESQPHWMTPLATVTPRLEEEFRYDQFRESLKNGSTVDVYDGGKGLELIPTERTEVIITTPAYQVRRGVSPESGTSDWPGILLKYRLLSANEEKGNYIVTVFFQYGWPTGALANTTHNHVFTPTLALGKGWGKFDLQATVGEAMPTQDHSNAGRSVLSNLTAQYHLGQLFWPEVELNRTDWYGGARNARSQTYLTTGLILGRFPIGGRRKMIVGLGYQTPVSTFYPKSPATPTYDHNWILSTRMAF